MSPTWRLRTIPLVIGKYILSESTSRSGLTIAPAEVAGLSRHTLELALPLVCGHRIETGDAMPRLDRLEQREHLVAHLNAVGATRCERAGFGRAEHVPRRA